jgi:hypothetical protein
MTGSNQSSGTLTTLMGFIVVIGLAVGLGYSVLQAAGSPRDTGKDSERLVSL